MTLSIDQPPRQQTLRYQERRIMGKGDNRQKNDKKNKKPKKETKKPAGKSPGR